MEYRLGKTLDSNGIFLSNHSYVNLMSNPLNDYVNPGIGMATRLYSLYVPIQSIKPKFTIEKESEIESKESKNEQLGFGSITDNESESFSKSEPSSAGYLDKNLNQNKSDETEIKDLKDDFKSSENENTLKRGRMDNDILDSFMHPKIKVGKIEVKKNEGKVPIKTESKKNVLSNHKFKII